MQMEVLFESERNKVGPAADASPIWAGWIRIQIKIKRIHNPAPENYFMTCSILFVRSELAGADGGLEARG